MPALEGPITAIGIRNPNLSTELYVHSAEYVGFGFDEKYALTASLGSEDEEPKVHLFQRPYDERVVAGWLHCLKIGIPVPPTFREVRTDYAISYAGKQLLVTDVTANGAAIYGKGLNFNPHGEPRRPNGPLKNDTHFMELTYEANMPKLRERAYALADHATDHNTILPNDDPFELIVNQDGSSQLMVLDLNQLVPNTSKRTADVRADNAKYVESTLHHLTELRTHLEPIISTKCEY
jgi:hypothetical protein